MAEQVPPRRARLGDKLRELRARRHRSGSALARELGWGQSRVSKLERGAQLPSEADLDAWVDAAGGTAEDRAELADLLAGARLAYTAWEERWRTPGAIAGRQRDIAEVDRRASVIKEYQPSFVPGLAQTPAYARSLLSCPGGAGVLGGDTAEIDALVDARVERQQLLYTPGKRIELLLGEAALRTRFGDGDVMVGQLDRLAALAGLSSVDLAVLPFDRQHPIIPVSGFTVLDDHMVVIETLTGEQELTAADEIASYTAAFDAGQQAALRGSDAVAFVRRLL